jgi:pimeloyl-ACP methyl ester carboxylesterase
MMARLIPAMLGAAFLFAANGQDLAGLWLGTLHIGPSDLRLALRVVRHEGLLTAIIDSLDQGASGIPATRVQQDGRGIRIEIDTIHSVFEGTMNAAGTEIAGTWQQGVGMPLVFARVEKLPETAESQAPKKPYPYDEVEVTYENRAARVKFAGTLTLPRTDGPHAAVLLITGSGPQDRDESFAGHKPFLILADYLTRRGIAVLRVDDRGVGGSSGSVNVGTTDDFAGDVLAGVEFLKSRREIDPRRIGLAGHSEGGIVAAIAAARSKDVAFIVLMAGPGVTGDRIIAGQSYAAPKAMGASEEGAAMNRDLALLMVDAVKRETDLKAAERRFEQRLAALMASWSEAQRNAVNTIRPQLQAEMARISSPWFRVFLTLDPGVSLRQVQAPVLALNGDLDTQVLARDNLPAIVDALEAGGNKDYTAARLAGLNHLLQTARTGAMSEYAQIAQTIAPSALETIGDWILAHSAR